MVRCFHLLYAIFQCTMIGLASQSLYSQVSNILYSWNLDAITLCIVCSILYVVEIQASVHYTVNPIYPHLYIMVYSWLPGGGGGTLYIRVYSCSFLQVFNIVDDCLHTDPIYQTSPPNYFFLGRVSEEFMSFRSRMMWLFSQIVLLHGFLCLYIYIYACKVECERV